MEKLDLKKQYKHLYNPPASKVTLVEVPAFNFALIDGEIEAGESPGTSPAFGQAMEALYGIAYTLKFMAKQRAENPVDYTVMGLEAQWCVPEGSELDLNNPNNWRWTAMILQPEVITEAMFQEGLEKLRKKKPGPGVEKLRFETFCEGLSVQIMHIGPYKDEPVSLAKMDEFAAANGYEMHGKHHEIYLGDPRRADPSKLKTVLRHPVRLKAG